MKKNILLLFLFNNLFLSLSNLKDKKIIKKNNKGKKIGKKKLQKNKAMKESLKIVELPSKKNIPEPNNDQMIEKAQELFSDIFKSKEYKDLKKILTEAFERITEKTSYEEKEKFESLLDYIIIEINKTKINSIIKSEWLEVIKRLKESFYSNKDSWIKIFENINKKKLKSFLEIEEIRNTKKKNEIKTEKVNQSNKTIKEKEIKEVIKESIEEEKLKKIAENIDSKTKNIGQDDFNELKNGNNEKKELEKAIKKSIEEDTQNRKKLELEEKKIEETIKKSLEEEKEKKLKKLAESINAKTKSIQQDAFNELKNGNNEKKELEKAIKESIEEETHNRKKLELENKELKETIKKSLEEKVPEENSINEKKIETDLNTIKKIQAEDQKIKEFINIINNNKNKIDEKIEKINIILKNITSIDLWIKLLYILKEKSNSKENYNTIIEKIEKKINEKKKSQDSDKTHAILADHLYKAFSLPEKEQKNKLETIIKIVTADNYRHKEELKYIEEVLLKYNNENKFDQYVKQIKKAQSTYKNNLAEEANQLIDNMLEAEKN